MESFYLKNSYRKKKKQTKKNTFGHKPPLSPKTVLLAWCVQEAPLGHAPITAAQKPAETPRCLHTRSHSQLTSLPWEPRLTWDALLPRSTPSLRRWVSPSPGRLDKPEWLASQLQSSRFSGSGMGSGGSAFLRRSQLTSRLLAWSHTLQTTEVPSPWLWGRLTSLHSFQTSSRSDTLSLALPNGLVS